jgi:hypothetical protein
MSPTEAAFGGPRRRRSRVRGGGGWAAFIGALAIPLYLALRHGGFDLQVHQEVALVAAWGLAICFAFGIAPRSGLERYWALPLGALAALMAWSALGLLWTGSRELTFDELALLVGYGTIVLAAVSLLGARTWFPAAAGLSIAAVAVPCLALVSRLAPDLFPADLVARTIAGDRLSYPLDYWNAVGIWGAMGLTVALAWSAHSRERALRCLSLALVPACGLTVYLTYSRASVVSALIGVALVIGLSRERRIATIHAGTAALGLAVAILAVRAEPQIAHGTGGDGASLVALALVLAGLACGWVAAMTLAARPRRAHSSIGLGRVAVGLVTVAVVVGLVTGPSAISRFESEFTSAGQPPSGGDPAARLTSASGPRAELWASAMRAFEAHPVKGLGEGTFQFWWYRDVPSGQTVRNAHSLYLESLAEGGLPGFLAVVAFLGGLLWLALRGRSRAEGSAELAASTGLVSAYAAFLFAQGVDWTWEIPALTVLGLGAAAVPAMAGAPAISAGWRGRGAVRVGLTLLALLAGAVQIPGIVATDRIDSAKHYALAGLEGQADREFDDAIAAEPWAATPYASRSFVEFLERRWRPARADAREAIEREPVNWLHWVLLGRIESRLGHASAAHRALERAKELRPGLASELKLGGRG